MGKEGLEDEVVESACDCLDLETERHLALWASRLNGTITCEIINGRVPRREPRENTTRARVSKSVWEIIRDNCIDLQEDRNAKEKGSKGMD